MGVSANLAARSRGGIPLTPDEPQTFGVLKELTRNGYVPDTSDIEASGILLRHEHAPDLILHADGRLEVPVGQPKKAAKARMVPGVPRGMSWRRTLATILFASILWFLSVAFTASLLEGM